MQKARRDKLVENEQNITIVAETNEKKNTVIINEYQTRFQNEYNTYEIKDGKLYGVGDNGSGQLGQHVEEQERRTNIAFNLYNLCCITEPVFIMDHVKYASAGGGYIMVLSEEGTLYSSEPVHVMEDIAFIAADAYTAAAISKKGDFWVWGDNSFGEIGNRRRGNGLPSVSTDVVSEPYLALKQIKEVRFEDFTVYAVNFQNKEYSWGKNATAFPKPVAGNLKNIFIKRL